LTSDHIPDYGGSGREVRRYPVDEAEASQRICGIPIGNEERGRARSINVAIRRDGYGEDAGRLDAPTGIFYAAAIGRYSDRAAISHD
jgi:hypothetical protein